MKALYLAGITVFVSSCTTLYKPSMVHSPLLKEKGELEATVAVAGSGTGAFNGQVGYALTDHWAVMGDVMFHPTTGNVDGGSKERLRMFSGSGGIGYFVKNDKGDGLLQVYGGIGNGHTSDRITGMDQQPDVKADYSSVFIQPGISYLGKHITVSGDLRFSHVNIYHIQAYLYEHFGWWNTEFTFKPDTTLQFGIAEPIFTFTAGGKNVKAFFQTGLTIPVWKTNSYFAVCRSSMLLVPLFRIGAGVRFNLFPKDK